MQKIRYWIIRTKTFFRVTTVFRERGARLPYRCIGIASDLPFFFLFSFRLKSLDNGWQCFLARFQFRARPSHFTSSPGLSIVVQRMYNAVLNHTKYVNCTQAVKCHTAVNVEKWRLEILKYFLLFRTLLLKISSVIRVRPRSKRSAIILKMQRLKQICSSALFWGHYEKKIFINSRSAIFKNCIFPLDTFLQIIKK